METQAFYGTYSAVAYAVVSQLSKVYQSLVVNKSRLSKKDTSITRLVLITTHMAANLATNTKAALTDLNITSVTERTNSTVVSLWLREQRNNKIFVEKKGLES